jgi:hypothetical protein
MHAFQLLLEDQQGALDHRADGDRSPIARAASGKSAQFGGDQPDPVGEPADGR